ncbi:MAG: helix-turn-helix domain-containing protein [Clostridia bacterium]|nr:helix-turn-helix domain-containing protein [Clostridia bacterium]
MRYIKIKSLPKIRFAHVFASEKYVNELPVQQNKIELCYIAKGVNHVRQGGVLYTEDEYDVACNLFEAVTYVQTEAFHEHHSVGFTLEFEVLDKDAEGALLLPRHFKCNEKRRIHELLDEIISVHTFHPTAHARLVGLFLNALAELDELARRSLEGEGGISLYVKKAKSYVYENIRRPIRQKEVAAHLGITPEYLCSAFKSAGEEPLITFINKTKLKNMRTVMRRENLKLYEVAEMFGYADPNYASRLYKKYFGKNITEQS